LRLRSSLVIFLCGFLTFPVSVPAQQTPAAVAPGMPAGGSQPAQPLPAVPSPPQPPLPKELKIIVLQGEGARNNIKAKTAVPPVVEVRDEADKPVEQAEVVFQLPAAGPGGVFHGWMRTQTVRTNAQGQAGVSGYIPNDQEGRFNIKVTATKGAATASAVIAQNNTRTGMGSGTSKSRLWKILAVAGTGAAVGGIVAATRGGGSSGTTSSNAVTISPGTVTISSPK